MTSAKHHRHQADVPAGIAHLDAARDAFRRYLEDCGTGNAPTEIWMLAFTEAFANAVTHRGDPAPGDTVRVEWWQDPDRSEIVLEVENRGVGPSPEKAEHASLPADDLAESGRGMFMIRELVDRVEHWRCGDRYRIVLACHHEDLVPDAGTDGNLQMALEELENTYEHLAAFHALGKSLIASRPPAEIIREGLSSLAAAQSDRPDLIQIGIAEGALLAPLAEDLLQIPDVVEGGALPLSARAILAGSPSLLWGNSDAPQHDPALAPFRSGCCLPIVAGDLTLGVLVVARRAGRPEMHSSEIGHYRTFADLFAIALANANLTLLRDRQKHELRDFEIATEIQRAVLNIPAAPVSDRWELFLRRQSAEDVAGDYVEAVQDSEGRLVMSIVDVMGKGVSAAILAGLFRTALHSHLQRSHDLPDLVASINRTLCRQIGDMTMFLTCLIARLDPHSGLLEVINAGHCPLILMRASGGSEEILPTGSPLGLFPDDSFRVVERHFRAGDSLVMVTDGLFEWESSGHLWGWDALVGVALSERASGSRLWSRLQEKIGASGSAAASDDQTLLFLRLLDRKPQTKAERPPHFEPVFARRSL